jgi:hypothetical protein
MARLVNDLNTTENEASWAGRSLQGFDYLRNSVGIGF